jgi:hypothetical protein
MSEWMDRFLADRKEKNEQRKIHGQMLGLAISSTPVMVARLAERLTEDIHRYSAETGKQINAHPNPTGIQLSRDSYPTVYLELKQDTDRQPLIHCTQRIRKSTSATHEDAMFDIQIIAEGQDKLYYRLNGVDRDQTGTSEAILLPLLSMLEN